VTRVAAGLSIGDQGSLVPSGRSWAALRRDWGRPVFATAILLAFFIAHRIFGIWHAGIVTSPTVQELASRGQVVDIAVRLSSPPERFHLQYMQNLGQIMRINGRTFYLKDVPPRAVRHVASEYWVSSVTACGAPCR
jgi:hypothetical protein